MDNKNNVVVPHPEFGHVIFSNPTPREREILEDYVLTKKTMKQIQPFIKANVQSFNGIRAKDILNKVVATVNRRKSRTKSKA